MLRTKKASFYANASTFHQLYELNRTSALVWNECLKLAKEYYQRTGKWINQTELQKLTKGRFPLHSQSIQAVVHKYFWARDNAKKAKNKGYTGSLSL